MSNINYIVNMSGEEYVGINFKKNREIDIFLPIGFEYKKGQENEPDFKQSIRKLFKLLANKKEYQYKKQKQKDFNFISAVKVLENYLKYGLYKQTENITKVNQRGKIDWKKTINAKQTYMQDKIIYQNIFVKKTNYYVENIIQKIQEEALSIISQTIGFLWDFNYKIKVKTYLTISQKMDIINKEIKNTNQDNKLEVLQNLKAFIESIDVSELRSGRISFKYKEFEFIWQELVDFYGVDGKEKNEYQPKANYYYDVDKINKDIIVKPSLPDTVIIEEDYVYVLDAKYYKIGNFPNEYDIFKQTRYGEYVIKNKKNNNKKLINAFILPKNLEEKAVMVEDYFAYLENGDKKLEDIEKSKIFVVYVDTKKMIENTNMVMKEVKERLKEHKKQI